MNLDHSGHHLYRACIVSSNPADFAVVVIAPNNVAVVFS